MKKIIALIPTVKGMDRGYLTAMLNWLNTSKEVDGVEVLEQEIVEGVGTARRKLVEQAVAKYGYDVIYLMLDDDCTFDEDTKIRWAADLMTKGVGIVALPSDIDKIEDVNIKRHHAYHCFLLDGNLIKQGINYSDGEYCDETDFSLQAFFAGYEILATKRCRIAHHKMGYTKLAGSLHNKLISEGKLSIGSELGNKYPGLISFETINIYGKEIPNVASLVVTADGRGVHEFNKKLL